MADGQTGILLKPKLGPLEGRFECLLLLVVVVVVQWHHHDS
jgi:hypothetical protein